MGRNCSKIYLSFTIFVIVNILYAIGIIGWEISMKALLIDS